MRGYFATFSKLFVFSGRASRKEFWVFYLINTILLISVYLLSQMFIIIPEFINNGNTLFEIIGLISYLLAFVFLFFTISFPWIVFIPTLAVMIRRLHDTNRSGWNLLLGLIPFIGGLIIFMYSIIDSTPGENKYGLNPKR